MEVATSCANIALVCFSLQIGDPKTRHLKLNLLNCSERNVMQTVSHNLRRLAIASLLVIQGRNLIQNLCNLSKELLLTLFGDW